jgi:hypothetical protein
VRRTLGYIGAGLTVLGAALIPFVGIDVFTRAVAATGVRTAAIYSGGEPAYAIDRGVYRIVVHRPVHKTAPLQRVEPFVQIAFRPASALPARIEERLDVNGDGRPDLAVAMDVPRDPAAPLAADVAALSGAVKPVGRVTRESFSRIAARVGDAIVVRVPVE